MSTLFLRKVEGEHLNDTLNKIRGILIEGASILQNLAERVEADNLDCPTRESSLLMELEDLFNLADGAWELALFIENSIYGEGE